MTTAFPALPVDDATMADIFGRLVDVGVVSDEDAAWLTPIGLRQHLGRIENDIRTRGYEGGALTLHTFDRDDEGWATIAYDTERFESPVSAQRVWEEARFEQKRRNVQLRADDWIRRLLDLKAQVGRWIDASGQTELGLVDRLPVRMAEPPMRAFGVAARDMPAFDVRRDNKTCLRFQPRGLWTLGANGRVDLITRSSSQILVDRSPPMSSDIQWTVFSLADRRHGTPFTLPVCLKLVSDGRLS